MPRSASQRFVSLAALTLLASTCRSAFAQTVFGIGPRSTFYRTNADSPTNPLVVDLTSLGIAPGNLVLLERIGGIQQSQSPGAADLPLGVTAAFSSTSAVLGSGTTNRIPGAVASGLPAYVTPPTFFGGQATDIAEDFIFDSVVAQVPSGSGFLFFGSFDTFYGDNTDPNGDFAVRITLVTAPEPSSLALVALAIAPMVIRRRKRA